MNPEDDHNIKSFFAEMRKKEKQLAIPEFDAMLPQKKSSPMRYIIPIGIAASLIIGFGIWTTTQKTSTPEETLVITIESEETNAETPTESLLTDTMSVFSWQSETDALINDFND
ncbi:hypothetical protein ACFO3O_15595 [Dokdonia ponticola]|uniref:Anti-sigma factor n=1 Tax=Dokdonia ponticola TaxID=2041041 RepID=A0ABV9HZH4_9FLAO